MPHMNPLTQRERPTIPTSHFIHSATDELALDCKRLEDMLRTPRAAHRQSYYSLYWVTGGKATASIDFVDYPLGPATFALLQPGQVFQPRVAVPLRGLAVFFARDFLALESLGSANPFPCAGWGRCERPRTTCDWPGTLPPHRPDDAHARRGVCRQRAGTRRDGARLADDAAGDAGPVASRRDDRVLSIAGPDIPGVGRAALLRISAHEPVCGAAWRHPWPPERDDQGRDRTDGQCRRARAYPAGGQASALSKPTPPSPKSPRVWPSPTHPILRASSIGRRA